MSQSRAEAAARRLLRPSLRVELRLAKNCEQLFRTQAADFLELEAPEPYQQAQSHLLGRVADDIRCSVLMALNGYTLAMMTVASSIYELGYVAAYICNSNTRATEWLEWKALENGPWPRSKYVTGALQNALEPDHNREFRDEDKYYKTLCWAKHGNPRLQQAYPVSASAAAHMLNVDPDVTPRTAKRSRTAFYIALRPAIVSLMALSRHHVIHVKRIARVNRAVHEWCDLEERLFRAR